jgi:DNA-binding response OmpR family regulator
MLSEATRHKKTPLLDDVDEPALADAAIGKTLKPVLLIVEDNDDLREFMKDSLSTEFDIHESSDGKMGLSMAQKLIPELIISDIMMPEMDGLELCRCLKSDIRTSHIPVILLTAKSTINDQISGLEQKADAYITKPFNLTLLITQIRNLIDNRKHLQLALRNRYLKLNDISIEEVMIDRFLEDIVSFIEGNLDNGAFSVSVLAKHAAMSQPVLYKKIKALTGMSVNDFIKSIRLKKAAGLILTKKHTIYEVAYMVGFSDRKYFSKEFKKAFGMSPTMYMERDTSDFDATFV